MTTLDEIRAIVREVLTDTTQWPDATLNTWINQGIRDYSHYFPNTAEDTIPCADGKRDYLLGATYCPGIISVLRVEYPDGEEPPRYLARLDESSSFFLNGGFYDLRGSPHNALLLGESPSLGEEIAVQYTCLHEALVNDEEAVGIPDQHLEAISIFCIWKAAEEIFMTEEIDPDTKEFLVSQMGLNAARYERVYRSKIAEYQSGSQSRRVAGWRLDGQDRIY